MADKRSRCTEFLLTFMKKVTKSERNFTIYKDVLTSLTDAQFEEFITRLEDGAELTLFAGNMKPDDGLNYDHLITLCQEYNASIMAQLVIADEDTGLTYVTPQEYLVGTVEIRRQREMQTKKFGAGKDDTRIDDLTGQVFGDSRGAGISVPEIRVLENLGLPRMALELYDIKGGDPGALDAYRTSLQTTGTASLNESLRKGSGVKSLQVAQALFTGRHIKNNIGER